LKSDTDYLCNLVGANFRCAVNKKERNYCGFILDWNYKLGYIDISMLKYIPKTLQKLNYQ